MHDELWFKYWENLAVAELAEVCKEERQAILSVADQYGDNSIGDWLFELNFPANEDPGGISFTNEGLSISTQSALLLPQAYLMARWFKCSLWFGDYAPTEKSGWITANSTMQWEAFVKYLCNFDNFRAVVVNLRLSSLLILVEFLSFVILRSRYIFNRQHTRILMKCRFIIELEIMSKQRSQWRVQ